MTEPQVLEGFERHFRQSLLTELCEPLYSKRDGERFHLGLHVDRPHCNSRGKAHGGFISALADNAMGIAYVEASGG
jgi:acyl-coenzyme A thioesterase PaaI-like protein